MAYTDPIESDAANAIFDLLVAECAASEHDRDLFLAAHREGCREYRFMGSLGFGGKFWNYDRRWYVNCYPEDMRPERTETIGRANELLARLKESMAGV
jgi:hypothetical protein